MSTFSFPSPESYGQALPTARAGDAASRAETSENGELFNLLTLADLTLYKNPRDVSAAAKRLLEKTDLVADESLRTSVRLALAQAQAEPENFPEIRARHFRQISLRFTEIADEARKNKNYKAALNAAQFAAKADPKNLRARLILAVLVNASGDAPTALKLMHAGLKFIDLDAPVTKAYFTRYFEMLAELQQDYVAADQAEKILKSPNVPAETRRLVALAGAFALYNRGQYAESLALIARERLDEDSVQGRILKARNLFASGERAAAAELLEASIGKFPADRREPIFNQLSRFFSETGNYRGVVDVAARQLEENPDALGPRLRRLFAYKKLSDEAAFSAELENIFAQFSDSQGALVALSNFAAEQGLPEIALRCVNIARERHFDVALPVAAAIEALVADGRPAEAISAYVQVTGANPQAFEEFASVISAVLASAYAETATQESDPAQAEALRAHSELLLGQFLSNKSVTPENFLAAIRHFRRIGRDDLAGKVATAALKTFPWHSQIRADWILLQLAQPEALAAISVPAEVRTLAQMRRPNPVVWKEILAWLDSAPAESAVPADGWSAAPSSAGISAEERAQLRALVAPLAQ